MKSIKEFYSKKNNINSSKIFGGKAYATSMGRYGDTFYDNDNNGYASPGDSICFHTAPPVPQNA